MYILKKCPLCGGKAELTQVSEGHDSSRRYTSLWEVRCLDCGLSLPRALTKIYQEKDGQIIVDHDGAKELVDKWNSRTENEN